MVASLPASALSTHVRRGEENASIEVAVPIGLALANHGLSARDRRPLATLCSPIRYCIKSQHLVRPNTVRATALYTNPYVQLSTITVKLSLKHDQCAVAAENGIRREDQLAARSWTPPFPQYPCTFQVSALEASSHRGEKDHQAPLCT